MARGCTHRVPLFISDNAEMMPHMSSDMAGAWVLNPKPYLHPSASYRFTRLIDLPALEQSG